MRTLKRTAALLVTLLWAVGCGLYSVCAGSNAVWAAVTEQSAVLYLPQSGEVTECLAGSAKCTGIQTKAISELEHPVHTLILLDNSLSIPKENREIITKLLDTLVGNRMQGELYTIATISDDIRYLCTAQSDYLSLGSAIDSILYENQNTQLTDRVYEAVQTLHDADPFQFCRVVIISDGVDDKQIGYTRTELEGLLRSCGYPIYTVGCGSNDTAERKTRLENLLALSRVNQGQSYYLGDTQDPYAIAKGICEYNSVMRVTAKLPDEVCDGSSRALQVTCGGTAYTAKLEMPFVAASSSAAASKPAAPASSVVQQPASGDHQLVWIVLAGAGAAVLLLAVVVILLCRKKAAEKAKKPEKKAPEIPARNGTVIVTVDDNGSGIQQTWNADRQPPRPAPQPAAPKPQPVTTAASGDATVRMFNNPRSGAAGGAPGNAQPRTLHLTDLNNPVNTYELPLDGVVSIGRAATCRLVLNRPSVSHHQCDLFVRNGTVCITNYSKTNPTRVNGRTTVPEMPLPDSFTLNMGNETMKAVIR